MNLSPNERADVLLVTVTDVETDAVHELLKERHGRQFSNVFAGSQVYRDLGLIGGARTFLMRSEMGSGGVAGSLLTVIAGINDLKPTAIIMLGIAFGIDPQRQQIGDVLVGRQLLLYDLQRVGADSSGAYMVRPRGDRPSVASRLLALFRAGRDNWRGAPLHFGLLLSGDKLVDNQDFRDQLQHLEPEAIGGEMEGAGLYAAAQTQKVDWILIKAISDWADGTKNQQKAQSQRLAAHNAAEYVFHVIEQGGLAAPTVEAVASTPQAHPTPPRADPQARPQAGRPAAGGDLRMLLTERLDSEELNTICFDLSIDPDNLPGSGKAARVRELIAYLTRRNSIEQLRAWIRQNRPDIELPG